MGSTSTRGGGDDDSHGHKPHFFKIILDETIREGKLIPRKFVRKYGDSLPNSVLLTVPGGVDWHVELSKRDDHVWFENGWEKFADYYSLEYGHFLVFEYQGNRKFNVLIFDKSAIEIYYLEEPKHVGEPPKEPKIERNANDVSINRRARARSPVPGPRSQKRKTVQQFDVGETSTGLKSKGGADERKWVPRSQKITKAVQRANGFKSENPYFKIFIQPSYVGGQSDMSLPKTFVSKYMKQQSLDTMLTVEDKSWPVRLASYKSNSGKIGLGGRSFVKENALQIGDVCVFELINTEVSALKVTIFRSSG
ncbi:B3 domain-containing transcription factor VRN1-like isoform X2 [Tripterygium wilfordii]|uniref:B3 domain-containing transcription factor VRN1-like isoform X2 n=1 Tax=Tripterygium wilfordii TaxID=458696 RepID=UPI0018F7E91A|nr:B3 domain-containing transcription factor VRN1-like isoform X2 [Tripterygium wilfordii]